MNNLDALLHQPLRTQIAAGGTRPTEAASQ